LPNRNDFYPETNNEGVQIRERRNFLHPKNFVICDVEREYSKNLLQALNNRKEFGFQIYLFHDIVELEEFSRQVPVSILLIDDSFPVEIRKGITSEQCFILQKDRHGTLNKKERGIFKYQSVDALLCQIFEETFETGKNLRGELQEGVIIGVYSPIHRIGKTTFALELGRELAKKGPALYLNLEEYAGLESYLPNQTGKTLEDVIYFLRQEKKNLGFRIRNIAGQMGELQYVLPMEIAQDLRQVKKEEWMELFHQILEDCLYRYIILDLSDAVQGLYSILRECHTVYTPYIEDEISKAKMRQYTENLRRLGYEDVLEHTIETFIQKREDER
jgi:hypothetical protein